jgi:hypothetical protein
LPLAIIALQILIQVLVIIRLSFFYFIEPLDFSFMAFLFFGGCFPLS